MKSQAFVLAVTTALLTMVLGCTEESTTSPNPHDVEHPELAMLYNALTVGNQWTYQRGEDSYTVTAIDSVPEEYGTGLLAEGAVALYEEWFDGSVRFSPYLMSGDSLLKAETVSPGLLHRFNPLLLGDTVYVVGWFSSLVPVPLYDVLLDSNYTAVVPAGTFEHCLLIESTEVNPVDSTVIYVHEAAYAPEIGLVQRATTFSAINTTLPEPSQLVGYTLIAEGQ